MKEKKDFSKNITEAAELTDFLKLSAEERESMEKILLRYPMSITPYYLSLIDFSDENDPILKMSVPSIYETDMSGKFDTSGEADNTVVEGMQHKYRETALILSTNHCAMYCRHCFRKRFVGMSDDEVAKHLSEMEAYIRSHDRISNVLISGGDPLLLSNDKMEEYLQTFSKVPSLDFIRIGTRVPVVMPQHITENMELQSILKKYTKDKQIYIVTQFNHPREITPESTAAVKCLISLGIPVRNQTVLLKGINDDPSVLGELLKKLTAIGAMPYYIFQCRPVTGVKNQFQVPLLDGYEIVEKAKAMQNGFGKAFKYCMSHTSGKIEIAGKLSKGELLFKYHEAKYEKDAGRIFMQMMAEGQAWLDADVY